MTIDLAQFGRDIYANKDCPAVLNEINLKLAGFYAYYSSQLIPLKHKEADFWKEWKGFEDIKPKSDTYVRALWRVSKDGHEMTEVEEILKVIEKLMSTLRSSIHLSATELRNLQ